MCRGSTFVWGAGGADVSKRVESCVLVVGDVYAHLIAAGAFQTADVLSGACARLQVA